MKQKNKHPTEYIDETDSDTSANIIKNMEYIKKLEIQLSVLNKILDSDIKISETENNNESDNSQQPIKKQEYEK
jgi:hypothetical protein